jgi:hypothetical protein
MVEEGGERHTDPRRAGIRCLRRARGQRIGLASCNECIAVNLGKFRLLSKIKDLIEILMSSKNIEVT